MSKAKKRGPESPFLDELKGKAVVVQFRGETKDYPGRLVWVDTYSYGIEFGRRGVAIVLKSAVKFMHLAEVSGE